MQVIFAELELETTEIIIEDERAGQMYFGKVGSVAELNGNEVTVNLCPGVITLASSYVAAVKEFKPLNKMQKLLGPLVAISLI